jgi:membrane associated rhomboid family serine protease
VTTQSSGDGAEQAPVCPRHPDRESYVRCQRCERPTCPDCQRPAAVGIQCVDCVREQSRGKGVRVPRTAFGGSVGTNRPIVTQGLIGLCVLAFVLQKLPGSNVTENFDFAPRYATSQPWRLLTAAFLHDPNNLLHILFNMYALWLTGPYLEALLGRVRFAALYGFSAIGGSIGFMLLTTPEGGSNWYVGTVGASGAVFGLFAAYFVVQRKLNRDTGPLIGVIAINLVLGFILPGVAWQAHIGGLVTGFLVALALVYSPRVNRTQLQVAGLAAIAVLLALLFVVKVVAEPATAFV